MPLRPWFFIAALGWLIATASAQEVPIIVEQGQPDDAADEAQQGDTETAEEHGPPLEAGIAADHIEAATTEPEVGTQESTEADSEVQRRAQQDLQAQEDMAYWAAAMFWATLISVIVAFAAVILVGLTLREARRTTQAALVAADASRGAVAEAEKATVAAWEGAKAAAAANELADRSAKQQLQAYLWFDTVNIVEDRNTKQLSLRMNLKNFGQTPAYNVGVYMTDESFSLSEDKFVPSRVAGFNSCFILGPTDSQPILYESPNIWEKEKRTRFAPGSGEILMIWGKITFADIYDQNRWVEFCFSYSGKRDLSQWGAGNSTSESQTQPDKD